MIMEHESLFTVKFSIGSAISSQIAGRHASVLRRSFLLQMSVFKKLDYSKADALYKFLSLAVNL